MAGSESTLLQQSRRFEANGPVHRAGRHDADVIIVGAGPAGASLAAKLAAAGVDTLLLDRAHFPRDKVCGDFVGPLALAELATIGIPPAETEGGNIIRRAGFVLNGERLIEHRLPIVEGLPGFGRVVPRLDLDAMILGAALRTGARIREGMNVTSFASRDGAGEVSFRRGAEEGCLRAQIVVGADGSASAVARSLRGPRHPRCDSLIAVRAYYEGVAGADDCCDLYFSGDSFPGYYWLFPAGKGRANVGIGMVTETIPPVKEHLRDLLAARLDADPALRHRLTGSRLSGKIAGWPLSTYSPSLPLVGDNLLLLGDAAGLINPINGEGIQYAVLSARWAFPVILQSLRSGKVSRPALAPYESTVRRELGCDMALSRLIVHAIANRALNPLWLLSLRGFCRRAAANEHYAHVTGGVLSGAVNARDVLSPRILAASAVALVEEAAREGSGLLSTGPIGMASQGLRMGVGALRAAEALLRPGAPADFWLKQLLSDSIELGAEILRPGRPQGQIRQAPRSVPYAPSSTQLR